MEPTEKTVAVGETVTVTATVTQDGGPIDDLAGNGLDLWFWPNSTGTLTTTEDVWGTDTGGKKLSADISLQKEGTCDLVAELKNGNDSLCSATVKLTAVPKQEPTLELTPTINSDGALHVQPATQVDIDGNVYDFSVWFENRPESSTAAFADQKSPSQNAAALDVDGYYLVKAELYDVASDWAVLASETLGITRTTVGNDTYIFVVDADPDSGAELEAPATVAVKAYAFKNGADAKETLLYTLWADDSKEGSKAADIADKQSFSSAIATLPEAGTYYIVSELYEADWTSVCRQTLTYTVKEPEDPGEVPTPVEGELNIEYVKNLSDDFIHGWDISSIISEFDSGVKFKDWDGNSITNVTDFCQFIKDQGITHVRVRVWNDPYTADGAGYGGGNNDVKKAKQIVDACRAAGLKVLIDFHVSDFWADPGKQQAPKGWENYSLDQKKTAVYNFILNSLNEIDPAKDTVTMVQVGNETTNAFVGESGAEKMCALFQSGAQAVKKYNPNTKVVIHVTNPEAGNVTRWAKNLDDYEVDYDILATSCYPYWHGTLDNLKKEFQTVINTYHKDVMVAETSYAHTLENSDGHSNTVRVGNNDTAATATEPFTTQGQATAIRNMINAVNEAGGLGVFYWEPAWITVGDTTGKTGADYDAQVAANREKWEKCGSGWAAQAAGEYDPNDAGKWFGGSAVDNEAFFAPDGSPLESLRVYSYLKTGAKTDKISVEKIAPVSVTIQAGDSLADALPETVAVSYNDGTTVNAQVKWSETDIAAVDTSKPGTAAVRGTVTFDPVPNSGSYAGQQQAEAVAAVTVKAQNLLPGDAATIDDQTKFVLQNMKYSGKADDASDGTNSLNWWDSKDFNAIATYGPVKLAAGSYAFNVKAQGVDSTVRLEIVDTAGKVLAAGKPVEMEGYHNWKTPEVTFTLDAEAEVYLRLCADGTADGWGSADELYLYGVEAEAEPTPTPTPTPTPAPANPTKPNGGEKDTSGSAAPQVTAAPAPAPAIPQTADPLPVGSLYMMVVLSLTGLVLLGCCRKKQK